MITNEKQYKISRSRLENLKGLVESFDLEARTKLIGSEILAKAELDALKSEVEVGKEELSDYEKLKSGAITRFVAKSLSELPDVLIKARISQGMSQGDLATTLGLSTQQIQRYESNRYRQASLSRLRKIAEALKLNITEIGELESLRHSERELYDFQLDQYREPVKVIYKRGWFSDFTGSLSEALGHSKVLIDQLLSSVQSSHVLAFNRQHLRTERDSDEISLLAWRAQVISLAQNVSTYGTYVPGSVDDAFLQQIVRLSANEDGPKLALKRLNEIGIPLVVLNHLPSTYLDGAAILNEGTPIIGITLRYDRLDNFWFVLLHELAHVKCHLGVGGIDTVFDDFDIDSSEDIENEADAIAGNTLVPDEIWESALPRYVQSKESIEIFAGVLGISPSIVAGKIRYESNNYTILSDLVGQGEVRKQFKDSERGQWE